MLSVICALFAAVVKFFCAHQNKHKAAGLLCFLLKAEWGLSQTAKCAILGTGVPIFGQRFLI